METKTLRIDLDYLATTYGIVLESAEIETSDYGDLTLILHGKKI